MKALSLQVPEALEFEALEALSFRLFAFFEVLKFRRENTCQVTIGEDSR